MARPTARQRNREKLAARLKELSDRWKSNDTQPAELRRINRRVEEQKRKQFRKV